MTEMPALQVCALMAVFRSGPGLGLPQDGELLLFQVWLEGQSVPLPPRILSH